MNGDLFSLWSSRCDIQLNSTETRQIRLLDGETKVEIPPPELLEIFEHDSVPVQMLKKRKNDKAVEEYEKQKKKKQEEDDLEKWIKSHPKWQWERVRQRLKNNWEEEEMKKKDEDEKKKHFEKLANWQKHRLLEEQKGC